MLKSVSVAMAVCNGEKYLPQQLDSILEQLCPNDEVVISCDPSTDGTSDLVSCYSRLDSRIKIIENSNHGIVGNFNNAISFCTKDAVFICDQDDVWAHDKRSKMIARLNDSNADLVIHNVVHIDENGTIVSEPLFEQYDIGPGIIRNFARPRYSGCCMAFPARTKRLILPMPASVVNYDHWIGMACEVYGTVDFYDEVLLYHRLHGNNATTSTRPFGVVATQRSHLLYELIRRRKTINS